MKHGQLRWPRKYIRLIKYFKQTYSLNQAILSASVHGHLPDTSLKQQVTAALETDASLQECLQRVALPVQAVDDVGTRLDKRSLQHVGEQRKNRIERLELVGCGGVTVLDTGEQLGEDGQVEDEGSSQERVLEKERVSNEGYTVNELSNVPRTR